MNTLTDFINYELYPALFDRLDEAFPDMDFEMKGGNWQSSHYLNGEPTSPYREDKTVVTKKKPHLIHEQGGETLSLVDYQLKRSGHAPGAKGAELIEALRSLAGICGLELPDNDTEEYKAYQIRQEALEKLARKMKAELFEKNDLHIHVPDGATPKDGPSAGITMTTALASLVTGIPVTPEAAMTGEISLQGDVRPIGGLPEKLMAAQRAGVRKVFIPAENEEDLRDVPKEVREELQIIPVRRAEDVLGALSLM